jgi:hypothetical protein
MFGQGQFDDAEDDLEERLAREELVARTAGIASNASALSASRGLGGFGGGARNASEAAYLSMLGGAGDTNSPYAAYQRSAYARNPYLQGGYGSMPSPAESLYAAAARVHTPSAYGYGSSAPSPADYRGYGSTPQRDYANYFSGRSAQELQHAALMERAYGTSVHDNDTDSGMMGAQSPGVATTPASVQHSSKNQETPVSPPTPSSMASPLSMSTAGTPGGAKGGRGSGRGGRGSGRGGGRGRGKGSGKGDHSPSSPDTPVSDSETLQVATKIDDKIDQKWYNGIVPLGLPEDKYWLSELQVFLRSNFAEAFGATEADIAAPMHGRNKPIALGQVGIRCIHCRDDPPSERGQQATSYPSLISGIYNSVQQMLRLHYDCCTSMPLEARAKIDRLKESSSARGGRKQYWIDSAKRLGLVDTPHGIHFARDPYGPLPPLSGPSADDEAKLKAKMEKDAEHDRKLKSEEKDEDVKEEENIPDVEPYPLVQPEDMDLISDYLYLTLEQMQPCNLTEADKVGCYKGRGVGFHGLACKHCVGQAGCGRYFPASEASLSQTTTSQTIMNHVRNCRRCPTEIRENLELMKRARMGPDGKRAEKPKHGGRKVFFHRLWCRIQRIPMSEDIIADGGSAKRRANYASGRKRKSSKLKKRSSGNDSDDDESEMDDGEERMDYSDDETDTEEERSDDDDDIQLAARLLAGTPNVGKAKGKKNKKSDSDWHHGCVSLSKTDDPNWLSEMQCFVRSDLSEVFTNQKDDCLEGYAGRKEPAVGQVGIRCVFCKTLDESDRPPGYLYFPDSLSAIHSKVGDMIRLHYPSCPGMPEDVKATFRSLKGFGAKADDDTEEYWVDSARDIGLSDVPADPSGKGWGISFRREPLQPSPADDLDRENEGEEEFDFTSTLLRAEDRGSCTDHAMLLLRQIKPCRFKKSDRRGGPGARGRDRVIGFPGICCRHCSSKNSFGRYFPVSAKNLTDNTANSLQAHVSSCSRCPENIKASLAYLVHRGTLQKSELSGSWKKTFFKRIWERLHVERAWSTEGAGEDEGSNSGSSVENDDGDGTPKSEGARALTNGGDNSEDEETGEDMTKLIKAAAVWLSEQDTTTVEGSSSRSRTAPRGRALPSGRRSLPFSSPRARGRGSSITAKRKRGNSS